MVYLREEQNQNACNNILSHLCLHNKVYLLRDLYNTGSYNLALIQHLLSVGMIT